MTGIERELEPLVSNGFKLDMSKDSLGRLEPSDPTAPIKVLREQFKSQGYLWLKGLLPSQDVLAFRARYFEAHRALGLLAKNSQAVEGIYSGQAIDARKINQLANQIVRWAAYESFCFHPRIWQFYEAFMGGAVYLHKRKLIRHTLPHVDKCTGSHYDLTYLRGGTDTVCTSWIPIGDIPIEMGGLVYLEGSDKLGREIEADFSRKNADLPLEEQLSAYNKNMGEVGWLTKDLPALANKAQSRWLAADYETGDMVIHSAYMIHAATLNASSDNVMRLSTDIRYQLVNEQIDKRWADHWSTEDGL
jgi:ectoine hydroxylase-related dioxygenase (phytanoyl-CoA dioxygenase family)